MQRAGVPLTSRDDAVETALKIVAKELAEGPYADDVHPNERRVELRTLQNWFYEWRSIINEAVSHEPIMVVGAPLSVFSGDR